MATLLRNNLNLKSLCRWRLCLKSLQRQCNSSNLAIPYLKNSGINGTKHFATAVHGFKVNNDPVNTENPDTLTSEIASSKDIDQVLRNIDFLVQRTGRTIRKSVENVFSMIEDQGFASSTQGLYLLRACAIMWYESPDQRVELAETIWRKLQNLGIQYEAAHFNSLLRIYVENNHPFSPSEFLATMESHKVEPNKTTFMYLLDKYANDGNISGASEVLQFMKDKGLPINEAVFNALIKGHMKAKDTSGARDILEVMRSSYLPSAETYTTLACGYAELGEIDQITSVIEEAQSNNISLSTTSYLSIISSLSAEHSTFVDKLIDRLDNPQEYRQDILNCILNLIHKDLDEVAYKLLSVISSGQESNSTNTFMKQLIKSEKPIKKVLDYCEKIYSQHLNEYIFINSAKAAVEFQKPDHAMAIFEELHKRGIPVRTSLFGGLLTHFKNSEEGIWLTLKKMYELGVPPDFITYEQHVFPAISLNNVQETISKFKETGLTITGAIDPLFKYYCHNGDVDNALYLIENYQVRVSTSFDLEKFLSLYDRFRFNTNLFCKILNHILKRNQLLPQKEAEELQGKQLAILIRMNPVLFQNWIKWLREEKDQPTFNRNALETCWRILRAKAPELLFHLKVFQRNQPQTTRIITSEEEERELSRLAERGVSTERYLIERLAQHIKEKNIERVNQLLKELDEKGTIYPPVIYANLLTLYCDLSDHEAAGKALSTLKEKYPTFNVDSVKLLDYAVLLIKVSKLEEAKKIVAEDCKELNVFGHNDTLFRCFKRLFYAAIETCDIDLVKSVQGSLMHHAKEFPSTTLFHEPLLKVHLHRNDLESAVEEFRNCVLNKKVMPCLNLMLKKCIIAEDQLNLKTVISLASELMKESAVLHEVAVAFLETGRKSQAAKVMENLGDRVNPVFIEDLCTRLYNQKQVTELENFLNIIQNVEHLGKEKLFYNLFKLYDERNCFSKALELYKWIEKEKLFDPSDRIKRLLSKLLQRNGKSLPFDEISGSETANAQNGHIVKEFLECVDKRETSNAIEKLEKMKKGIMQSIPANEMVKFLDLLIQDKHTSDIIPNNIVMGHIIENCNSIIKPLLEKYSADGDVESMKIIASFIPDFALKKVFFNTSYAKAHFVSEKYEDLLEELESHQFSKNNKIFSIAAFEGLLKVSNLEERVIKLAKGYSDDGFELPISILWAHYITNENYEMAEELYKSHTISVERVDTIVLKVVRQENNINMGKVYIESIKKHNGKIRSKERAYGTLLDVLVLKNHNDEAVALLSEAKEQGINLEKYYRSTLITLKSALEGENKKVPFTLPSEEFALSG